MDQKYSKDIKLALEGCNVYLVQKIIEEDVPGIGRIEDVMVFPYGEEGMRPGIVKGYNLTDKEILVDKYLDGVMKRAMIEIYEVAVDEGNQEAYKFSKLSHEDLTDIFSESESSIDARLM